MQYAITTEYSFWAGHAIYLPDSELEPEHFHNWQMIVELNCTQLDDIETVIDFHIIEALLADITKPWKGKMLNCCAPFAGENNTLTINPTAERIAEHLFKQISAQLPEPNRLTLQKLSLQEATGCWAHITL